MAAPTAAQRRVKLERGFQELATHYFNNAKSEADKLRLVQAMNRALRSFSLESESTTPAGCPPDWVLCPDGSCMPPGEC